MGKSTGEPDSPFGIPEYWRRSGKMTERQLSLFAEEGIPFTPDETSPMNNHLARSALFKPFRRGRRANLKDVLLFHQPGNEQPYRHEIGIYYTGEQLDMTDQDVFLEALRRAKGVKPFDDASAAGPPVENRIFFNRSDFLASIGLARGGPNYKKLEESFWRLRSGLLKIQMHGKTYGYNLVGSLVTTDAGDYYYYVPTSSFILFMDDGFGYVNMARRRKLRNRIDIAKWIQSFAASHSKGALYKTGLDILKKRMDYAGRTRDFRIAVREALTELVRIGEFENAAFDPESDIVSWKRVAK